MILCPLCKVFGEIDPDNFGQFKSPPTRGRGCAFCNYTGEVPADRKIPRLLNATVGDLVAHMKEHNS